MSKVTEKTAQPEDLNEQVRRCPLLIQDYIRGMINLSFYVYFHETRVSDSDAAEKKFNEVRTKTSALMEQTRTARFEAWEKHGPAAVKALLSPQFLYQMRECSQILYDDMMELMRRCRDYQFRVYSSMIATPRVLNNCVLGFIQIYHFVRKLPVQQQYSISALQTQVLEKELRSDLLDPWKVQVESLAEIADSDMISEEYYSQQHRVGDIIYDDRDDDDIKYNWPFYEDREVESDGRTSREVC
ncbi:LAFA_0B00782g1_1 [Lachancea sp. 'fantastica']|nr:LAFA_0B00782g1_1 [Lachancea sp. 'fantastica']